MGRKNRISAARRACADGERSGHSGFKNGKAGHDGEPPEFMPARDFPEVYVNGQREPVTGPLNINTDRIEWLFQHQKIDQQQYQAARILAQLWELSEISSTASVVLVGAVGGGGGAGSLPHETKLLAMQKHGAARKALGRNWPIVELVVEKNLNLETAGARLGVGSRYAAGALNAALHQLADHFRRA